MISLMLKAFFFFLLLGVSSLYAQTIPLRHFTEEDGLISNVIYSISRDKHGYLWFTSDKGICRFNGLRFKNFTTADGLPDNEVFNITEDLEGRLWLCSFNGAMCYYKDGKFFTAANTPWLKLPFKLPILRSFTHQDSSTSFIFNDYSKFVNVKHNKLRVYRTPSIKSIFAKSPALLAIKKLAPEQYRLFYIYGTIDINASGKILHINRYHDQKEFRHIHGNTITQEQDYLLAKDGIYNIDGRKLLFPIKTKINFAYTVALKIFNGNYFIGLLNGLVINDSFNVNSDSHAASIDNDVAGNIWFSAKGDGIYSLNKDFGSQLTFENVYSGKILYAKVSGNNVLFANNSGSLYKISNHKFYEVYNNNNYTSTDKNFLTSANFLINDSMDYILLDGEKALIIPDADKGLSRKKLINFPLSGTTIKEMFHDNGKLIVSCHYTLTSFDYPSLITQSRIKETEIKIQQKPGDKRIYGRDVNPQTHCLWFSQEKRMYALKDGQQIEKPALNNITLRQFDFFKDYIVGLSENNELIICKNDDDNVIPEKIVSKDCIWSRIYPIDQTHALISTNNYYRLLTLHTGYKNAGPDYIIQTIEDPFIPLRAEHIAADSNNCYFFKNGSITQIATNLLSSKVPPPIPVFSEFRTKTKSYPIKQEIGISYLESKSINITFDNISFIGKEIACQYSITNNGKDEWRTITGDEINLNTPGYGTYTVKIRSKTLSSIFSDPAVLIIHVQKPFWATWWFISVCGLSLIGLIWGIVIFVSWGKLRKKQKEYDADMKYQQSEYKALNALMNPHFIFNSLNNIQGLINKDEKRVANQYLVIFSELVRQNMHNISKGFISLQDELTLVENYLILEKLRFKELINYEIKVEEEVDVNDIMIPPLMIQPLVENAVKHGLLPKQSPLSKVRIDVYERGDVLYIIIEDNGIGLTQSLKTQYRLHESFGLSNLKKRAEHLKRMQQQEINIEVTERKEADGTVKGTQAIITIAIE